MSTTRDLIDALVAGDSTAIETTFDDVMTQKVSVALDDAKEYIAQTMFNPPEEVEDIASEEEQVDTEE